MSAPARTPVSPISASTWSQTAAAAGAEIRGPARQAIARDGLGPVEPARAGLAMEVLDPVGLRQWASATHERRPQNGQNLAAHTSAGDRGLPAIAKGYSERTGHPRLLRPPAGDAPCSLGALRDCTKSLGDVARDYDPSGGTERFKSSRLDQEHPFYACSRAASTDLAGPAMSHRRASVSRLDRAAYPVWSARYHRATVTLRPATTISATTATAPAVTGSTCAVEAV